jgi:hypothetical protein
MNRDEAVTAAMSGLTASLQQGFGAAYDAGANSVPQNQNGQQFAQADIDAAVAKVTAEDQSHMQDLQSQIQMDASEMASFKASMKDALSQALSILSPPAATDTTQSPGSTSSSAAPSAENVQAQTGSPLPDQNAGTNIPPAVSGQPVAQA